ncbi:MAG: DUF4296 domain-containing protein [Flavobacteriales bacterium]|nr:DUF4296 domain-containing protein [Flavobacteriales bacterium]
MRYALIALLVLFASCSEREAVPEGVMPRDEFTEVLLEMTLTEARMNHEITSLQQELPPMRRYYAGIFTAHGIDSLAFRRSFDHYAMRPREMQGIYEAVVEQLRVMKDSGTQEVPLTKDTTLATDSSSVRNR